MKFDIKNRFTGAVQFTAEIECDEDESVSVKLCLAVRWAYKTGAYLAGADLAGADLARANLAGAYLARANLARANLAGANLAGAYLPLAPTSLTPTSLAPTSLAPTSRAPTLLAPTSLAPTLLAPTSLAPTSLAPTSLRSRQPRWRQPRWRQPRWRLPRWRREEVDPSEIPVIPNIDSVIRMSHIEAGGVLDMGSWHGNPENHLCGTTHCRAGLGDPFGRRGRAKRCRTKWASRWLAQLIYLASRPDKPAPWFYASTDEALADIRNFVPRKNPMTIWSGKRG